MAFVTLEQSYLGLDDQRREIAQKQLEISDRYKANKVKIEELNEELENDEARLHVLWTVDELIKGKMREIETKLKQPSCKSDT